MASLIRLPREESAGLSRRAGSGQGGPRFPGFGVGRGFAIWGPFPVQAPDRAPETCTWSTRTLRCTLPLQLSMAGVALLAGIWHFSRTTGSPSFRFTGHWSLATLPVQLATLHFQYTTRRAIPAD